MERNEALTLLKRYNESESLLKHALLRGGGDEAFCQDE